MASATTNEQNGRRPRILFCSYHCYIDPSSGAALSVRDLFALLSARGWECQVLCGSRLDFEHAPSLPQLLREHNLPFTARTGTAGPLAYSILNFQQGDVAVTAYQAPQPANPPSREEGYPFLALLERVLDWFQPDLVLTYGGHWLAKEAIAVVKGRGIPVVFWLCNLDYHEADLFQTVDGTLVHSRFVQEFYRQSLGVECTAIPCPLDLPWCRCPEVDGGHVTFINPQPAKGLYWFAGIATELRRRRPDIPLLVVEGRGTADRLKQAGLDPATFPNLRVVPNTPDPRTFYRQSRVVLMPSLWEEPFGRVAAEACVNGIPVLATHRGGLPEVLAEAGFLFDVPAEYTPKSRTVPSAEEVQPWVDTIVRLWDDEAFYQAERQRCLAAAAAWHPDMLAARYDAYLRAILSAAPSSAPVEAAQTTADRPDISVIMPIHNGSAFLERAIQSVRRQTFERWELLAVDDGSTDDTYARLCNLAEQEPRLRVLRLAENRGCGAARNHALRAARGATIAYLDCDDEYYPDYLANVHARHAQADVLVFTYDLVEERPGAANLGAITTHNPGRVRTLLMQQNIATPLGVAHRYALLAKSGTFDESLHFQQDWDLWKRFAQARALFLFVNQKSGLYHIRADSQARTRRTPDAAARNADS